MSYTYLLEQGEESSAECFLDIPLSVLSSGFPCQDISSSNLKAVGITGARSGLWVHMARIIGEVRPQYAFVENSPLLVGRGLAVVLGDLAMLGYDARWCIVGAHNAGAPHKRDRIWILANSKRDNGAWEENMESATDKFRAWQQLHGASCHRIPKTL